MSDAQKARLVRLASVFEIDVALEGDCMRLSGPLLTCGPVCLPIGVGYARLLAELCSVTTRWIAYGPRRPCEQYLFAVSDERFLRLGELYREWKRTRPDRFPTAG
jgi:hypothetical protein